MQNALDELQIDSDQPTSNTRGDRNLVVDVGCVNQLLDQLHAWGSKLVAPVELQERQQALLRDESHLYLVGVGKIAPIRQGLQKRE